MLGLLLHNVLFTLGKAAELEDEAAGRAITLIQATSAWGAQVTMFMKNHGGWGIDDGEVQGFNVKTPWSCKQWPPHAMILILPVHAEGNNEGALTKVLGLLLRSVLFTLGKAAELEDEAAGRGTLAAINVVAYHNARICRMRTNV